MVVLLVLVVLVVAGFGGYFWWYSTLTPEQRRAHDRRMDESRERNDARQAERAKTGNIGSRKAFSAVSEDGACPKCGGTSFTAKRSVKGKVAAGVVAPKTQVKCVTCGAMFKRK